MNVIIYKYEIWDICQITLHTSDGDSRRRNGAFQSLDFLLFPHNCSLQIKASRLANLANPTLSSISSILFQLIGASSVDFMPYLSIFLPSSLIKCIKALNAKKMHLKIKARGWLYWFSDENQEKCSYQPKPN